MRQAETMILAQLPALLLPWYAEHARDLPWRRDRAPYHVWLSEVMLQQTRAEAVKPYYARFLAALPSVSALAEAPPEQLAKLWEGLGYYSRVRNLQKAARCILDGHGGEFPTDYAAIRALPGIGDYTAGAIASICFEQPTPAVDGNVLRVLARLCADGRSVSEEKTKRFWREALAAVYPAGRCGDFTQALMELGAVVCLPNGAPDCACCPCAQLCRSRGGDWKNYPVKAAKKARRVEEKTVFLLRCGARYALRRRPGRGLLAGLWEFPNVPGLLTAEAAIRQAEQWGLRPAELVREVQRRHIFTHVQWEMRGFTLDCRAPADGFVWVSRAEIEAAYALPSAFRVFWEEE